MMVSDAQDVEHQESQQDTENAEPEEAQEEAQAEESEEEQPEEPQEEAKDLYHREIERYRHAVQENKDEAYRRYGFTMAHSVEPEEYLAYCLEMGFEPETAVDFYNLGNVAVKNEDLDGAIDYYEKALSIDKQFAPALYNLAAVHEQKEDTKKAADHYKKYADLVAKLDSHPDFKVETQEEREAEAEQVRRHAETLTQS